MSSNSVSRDRFNWWDVLGRRVAPGNRVSHRRFNCRSNPADAIFHGNLNVRFLGDASNESNVAGCTRRKKDTRTSLRGILTLYSSFVNTLTAVSLDFG